MSFNNNITPGRPPLLWSDINDAFVKINENFDILVATIGTGSGLTPINFSTLDTDVAPTTSNLYNLGTGAAQWKSLHVAGYIPGGADAVNGVWVGSAQIKGIGAHVDIPLGSTLGGSLIIDPAKTFFKEIQVDNDQVVVATTFGDTLNLLSGTGIGLTVNSSADSIEIDNTGIISVAAGSGMTVSTASGTATVTNNGVRSLQSTTALPSGRTAGAGININGSTGDNLKITNTGVISISSGVGITVSADAATGDVTISNSAPAVNTYAQFEINGDSADRISADSVSDVLFINSGAGITLTKNTSTDTLTISVNPVFDLKGSVFGDDSSVLVDAVNGYIYGNVRATTLRTEDGEIALGMLAGDENQGASAVAVGAAAGQIDQGISAVAVGTGAGGNTQGASAVAIGALAGSADQGLAAVAVGPLAGTGTQGLGAVAIGSQAGQNNQGQFSIAIGSNAGDTNQSANSIILNASGVALNGSAAGLYIDPIRSTTSAARPVVYNSTTKELFYTSTLEFINSTISTNDSSGLTVDVQTTFNTDVTFENDITIAERLILKGSRVINLTELKSVVAASSSFADFQTRIAALV